MDDLTARNFYHLDTPTVPAADGLGTAVQRITANGGRVIPRLISEDGVLLSLATHPGRNTIALFKALGASNNSLTYDGMTAMTVLGTATGRSVTGGSKATRARRLGYVSAATAGALAGIYNSGTAQTQLTMGTGGNGGGFLAIFRFVPSDAAAVAGAHMFVGLRGGTASPVPTTSPATLTNVVGVAQVNGSANLQLVYGGSAAQSAIDLGVNFPAGGLSTDLYELILYCSPADNNRIRYRVERVNTGHVATGTLTAATPGTQLPSNATVLGPIFYRSNNATALAVGLDVLSYYSEADFV